MSLLGLLTIGRAFGGVRNQPASYRVANGLLPTFGRERVSSGADAVAATVPEPTLPPSRTVFAPPTSAGAAPELPLDAHQTIPGLAAPRTAKPEVTTPRHPPRSRPRTRGGAPVQGELSLESVRVVRNDLYADDLELIPRARPAAVANLLKTERPRRNPASAGWRGWLAHWRQWFRWQAG